MEIPAMRHLHRRARACQRGLPGAALAVALATLATASQAQTTCRTDALGATVCTPEQGPRPRPRPLVDDRSPGLERVQDRPPAGSQMPEIIPGWRENAFGRTLVGPGQPGPSGRCRSDMLGNTRCR